MSKTPPEPKAKLRWYQYRLAHLFVFVTICAIPCSWFACKMARARTQKQAVEAIEKMGGVAYDYQLDASDRFIPDAEPPGPAWLHNLVGVDFSADVVVVILGGPQVTDDDLEHLKVLTQLKSLTLICSQVTDAGLEHLRGMTTLKVLDLEDTQVTNEGVKRLRQALPNCIIIVR